MTFQAVTSNWRDLSNQQREAWNDLAAGKESGYQIYVGRNLNLWDVGLPANLTAAMDAPAFPAIEAFTVQVALGASTPLPYVAGFVVQLELGGQTNALARLRATPVYSQTRAFIRRGELRTVAVTGATAASQFLGTAAWTTINGTLPPGGTITWAVDLTDPVSGARAPMVKTTSEYAGTQPPPPPGSTIGFVLPSGEVVDQALAGVYVGPTLIAEPE
jgi:hypothetical protein